MNNPFNVSGIDFYQNRSAANWIVLVVSFLIGGGSIYYTSILVEKIKTREERLISLYANTLEYFANVDGNVNFNFIFEEIIVSNNSIPVVVTDEIGLPYEYKNIPEADEARSDVERRNILLRELAIMEAEHEPVLITLRNNLDEVTGYQYVYYKNSFLLTQLQYYPYVQLLVIFIFGIVAFMVFNYSRSAEQNKVWVGLAKETAHQLGTPLSSLMAWSEYLKSDGSEANREMAAELDKDIQRLEMITSRFSNIGSIPLLTSQNIVKTINEAINYLQRRVSSRVQMTVSSFPLDVVNAEINKPLFDWVIENICKNAVDAMGGAGKVDINITKGEEGKVFVDITDTGKGIPKSKINKVFQPGYTSKKRGWGLGLTLVKRIIENYHGGKIFVKSTEINVGTTFRIILKS
ncbi:MAG: HAMP domain-containing sensor histidine kinase [Cyclobacteriaceae bacterium]